MGRKLNKKGVSLAELLAVVVIMGIIAAIAIPLVGNVIETSKKKAFLGDLVTVSEAARVYCLTDKKSEDLYCTNLEMVVTPLTQEEANGTTNPPSPGTDKLKIRNGQLYANGASSTKIDNGDKQVAVELNPYMSKTAASIGTITIVQVNNKFYLKVESSPSGFTLAGGTGFVDPTDPNALENIPDK